LTIPNDFQRTKRDLIEQEIQRLRYATVCVNQWSGLAYSLLTPPWGGYPGATLQEIESGIGSVHNTFLLDRHEKSVLRGPLVTFPKPVWFPTNRNALAIARHLFALYQRPSLARFLKLLGSAVTA
jgi:aldehyde dehydrogenase (NAD(P)+)